MKEITLTDAKARLSSVVDDAVDGSPSLITRHGRKEAVVVSFDEWKKFTNVPSLWEMMTSAPIDGREFERDQSPMRDVDL